MKPLVSAILPTRGRPEWAQRALDCFLLQTYSEKELIILDDLLEPSFPNGVMESCVHYVTSGIRNIPGKRNECCAFAQGEIIMHIDSDDFSAPGRMDAQVQLLQESEKHVAGFYSMFFYRVPTREWWYYRADAGYALGTSLCYKREWQQAHPFPEALPVGEDNHFVKTAKKAGELISVDVANLMFARIHENNSSPKEMNGKSEYHIIPEGAVPRELRAG